MGNLKNEVNDLLKEFIEHTNISDGWLVHRDDTERFAKFVRLSVDSNQKLSYEEFLFTFKNTGNILWKKMPEKDVKKIFEKYKEYYQIASLN